MLALILKELERGGVMEKDKGYLGVNANKWHYMFVCYVKILQQIAIEIGFL